MKVECCCGQASLEVSGKAAVSAACHCNDCKKRTGSAFGVSIYFYKEDVKVCDGEYQVYSIDKEGLRQKRYFCKKCGSTTHWETASFPEMVGVAAGNIIGEIVETPDFNACSEIAFSWVNISDKAVKGFDHSYITDLIKQGKP